MPDEEAEAKAAAEKAEKGEKAEDEKKDDDEVRLTLHTTHFTTLCTLHATHNTLHPKHYTIHTTHFTLHEKGQKVEDEKKDDDEVLLSPSPTAQRTHHPHVSPKCNHMGVRSHVMDVLRFGLFRVPAKG